MPTKATAALTAALLASGCAATTPAPRFAPVSPADASGPEAGTPPPAPTLANEPEAQAPPPAKQGAAAGPAAEAPSAASGPSEFTCRMHPEVKQATPGSCTTCGMSLVKRTGPRP